MFRLSKWYMDCVGPDGSAVVGYWARLQWGLLRLRYAATLVKHAESVSEAATLRPGGQPRRDSDGLAWRCGPLHVRGHWRALDPPVRQRLLASDHGNVDWLCQMPRARARVIFDDGALVEGLGYVELLEMTLRPWQLPFRELRWGRFLSARASVVWIEWRGSGALVIVCVNGEQKDAGQLSDAAVTWRGGRLELQTGSVLRDGTLGVTALAAIPLLNLVAPGAVREIHECKRVRRGRLFGDNQVEDGWALDEVVRFGGDIK